VVIRHEGGHSLLLMTSNQRSQTDHHNQKSAKRGHQPEGWFEHALDSGILPAFLMAAASAPLISVSSALLPPSLHLTAPADAAQLSIESIQPTSPRLGVETTYALHLREDNGTPIKHTSVKIWFSAPEGQRLNLGSFQTDEQGMTSFKAIIPKEWGGMKEVKMNASYVVPGVSVPCKGTSK
jgi:hypothetical protein